MVRDIVQLLGRSVGDALEFPWLQLVNFTLILNKFLKGWPKFGDISQDRFFHISTLHAKLTAFRVWCADPKHTRYFFLNKL